MRACSIFALAFSGVPAAAQTAAPEAAAKPPKPDDTQIVVVGSRIIIAALKDVAIEKEYDEQSVASYAVSTVGELLDRIAGENGDDGPSILVNGRPISDLGDIADYPVEAIAKIESLPRGAAARVGGPVGQRAYNVVLKRSVRTLTLTASRLAATEGGYGTSRGEALATYVRGQDRINLAFRASDTGSLYEADRSVVPFVQSLPYAPLGNVVPFFGTNVDPALSGLAGSPVSSVALPAGTTSPALANLVAGINRINPDQLARYRTLRGASTSYETSLAGSKYLTSWLTFSANGRMSWSDGTGRNGLPTGRFLISPGAFSPFSVPVTLLLSDPARPLTSRTQNDNASLSATFVAAVGAFRLTLLGRYTRANRDYDYDFLAPVTGGFVAYPAATNPFGGTLAGLIPVSVRSTTNTTTARELSEELEGPLFTLPAGPVRLRAALGFVRSGLDGVDANGAVRTFRRNELSMRAGLTVPLTLSTSPIGSTDASAEIGRLDLKQYGKIDRYALAFNWQPVNAVRLSLSQTKDGTPVYPDLLAAPTVIDQNVRYFDPVRNETASVTIVSGGTANLANETQRVNRAALSLSPWTKYRALVGVTYSDTLIRNQIGGLPPPSPVVVAAFPDRFVRDGSGALILVDNRTVNFDRQQIKDLRTSIDFTLPLGHRPAALAPARPGAPRPAPPPQLQLIAHLAHTWLLSGKSVIRPGLATVDLLNGGAVGIGGGRQRHFVDASIALMSGQSGVRLNAAWRGASYLAIGSSAAPDLLTYQPYTKVDLRGFLDLSAISPTSRIAKGARVTVAIENLAGSRQGATTSNGTLPLYYQSIFRDPVGRTVSVELRKSF
ncbi:hypothetical protein ACOYW6_05390 [Parablastomonas sp. CN1-191]|uniref:hypothetical protein n=1 Tax=Parablastomonas sp. CN1-191 TaxID=3400908 RepID=UPI003BF7FFB0